MGIWSISAILVFLFIYEIQGTSTGAGKGACDSLLPGHMVRGKLHGSKEDWNKAYSLEVSGSKYFAGHTLTGTLSQLINPPPLIQ